jgi:hypothetical protein
MKAEKYIITSEGTDTPVSMTRFGYGVAGEEVQKLLDNGIPKVRVHVVGPEKETVFGKDRPWKLVDIKARIKNLTIGD